MLLLSMTSPVVLVLLPVVASPVTALVGRFTPAGPMLFPVIVLLLLPTMFVPFAVVVLNRTLPPAEPGRTVDEPRIEQFLMVLFCAPPAAAVELINRIVLVPAVAPVFVFENVSELPP